MRFLLFAFPLLVGCGLDLAAIVDLGQGGSETSLDATSGPESSTGSPDPTSTSASTTTTGTETTTAGSDCTPDGDGHPDPACPPDQPYCVAGACFSCENINCSSVAPEEPLCNESTGLCVACLCDDASPVCDPTAHTCSGCTAHSDCPMSACDLWTGACFPSSDTLWVDKGDGCDDAGPGDEEIPLCGLDVAFDRIGAAAPGHQAVRVRPGSYAVTSTLRVPADHVVAVVHATGNPGPPFVAITAAISSALAVDPGGKLIVDTLHVPKSSIHGVVCTMGTAWLDRLTVSDAAMSGIVADGCELVVRRSVLVSNVIGGVQLSGGSLRLENSYISENGNPTTGVGGVYMTDGASLTAVYSTWIDNRGPVGTPFSVACSDDGPKENSAIRNSLAINPGFNTLCDGAIVDSTGWSTDVVTGDNLSIAFADRAKYLTPDGSLPGVYRVVAGSGLEGLGVWEQGDPAVDFDGDLRPTGDNSPDFAGADRLAR